MRSRYRIPSRYRPYVEYLRKAGYYCTNRSKTDFNFQGNDRQIWDACSRNAHYKNRAAGQPFFAVVNLTVCHESSLFPQRVAGSRKRGLIPKTPRVAPATLDLPAHLPDLPEVRTDVAIYHDNVTAMDTQVGRLLDELGERGLADDTIVFYYSDHGGPTPRGKRYLQDTGVRVPMIVHVPEKWRQLSPFEPSQAVDELIAFVDLAPTVLSLAGIEKPEQMQGRAVFGAHREPPKPGSTVFLFADRFDEISGMRRGLTDGRFKYIRCFTPHLPAAPYSYYSLSMPSWQAWQQAWREGKLPDRQAKLWETPQPVEQLYDTQNDPWEINNLAQSSAHQEQLKAMRQQLQHQMQQIRDTGILPEGLFPSLAGEGTICDYVRSQQFPWDEMLGHATLAGEGKPENLDQLVAALDHQHPCARYWAAVGCQILGPAARPARGKLQALLADPQPTVRMTAACALAAVGERDQAVDKLLKELDAPLTGPESIHLINALNQVKAVDQIPQSWVDRTLEDPKAHEYAKRFAKRIASGVGG